MDKGFRNELSGDSSEYDAVVYGVVNDAVILPDQYVYSFDVASSNSGSLYRCTVYFIDHPQWTMQIMAESKWQAEREVSRRAEKLPYNPRGCHVEAM